MNTLCVYIVVFFYSNIFMEEFITEIGNYDLTECEIALEGIEEEIQDVLFRVGNCSSSTIRRDVSNQLLDIQEKKRLINNKIKILNNGKARKVCV